MFYLVGSRFFRTHRVDSDWDYLGDDTPANRELVESMGLKRQPTPKTGGVHYFGRYQGRWLDIVLVDDLMRRVYAREVLARLPDIKELSKAERHHKVWEIINTSTL